MLPQCAWPRSIGEVHQHDKAGVELGDWRNLDGLRLEKLNSHQNCCDDRVAACESSVAMEIQEFTNLLHRHQGLIRQVASFYWRDPSDREDVVQEITLQLWCSRHRYDDRFKETTWIYRIAINVAVSCVRRERRHHDRRVPLDEPLADRTNKQESNHDLELLMSCIEELVELDRALFLLFLEGQEHASIAEILGISVSNVSTRLHRIKLKLRAAYAQHQNNNQIPREKHE